MWPLKWPLAPEVHLLQTLILLLLVPNVVPYDLFIPPNRRYEISSRPEALTDEISPVFSIHPRQMYGAPSFDEANHLRNGILRRDRDHHVNMIGHQMSLLDPALLLLGQPTEYLPKILPQLDVQRLSSALRNENNVVFTSNSHFGFAVDFRGFLLVRGVCGRETVSGRPWRWPGEGQRLQQFFPGGEYQVLGDGGETVEEPRPRTGLCSGKAPYVFGQVADRMESEGQQIEHDEQSREVLLSVTEAMLKVVTTGLQNVERLVLDLPACAATGGEFGDVVRADR